MAEQTVEKKRILFFSLTEVAIIILLALVPLFTTFPYRVNIFLSWEGAYRLSQGEIPYKDFGMPLGYMYWVIPALFFKIFGTQMITLVKAQVFINILSGLAFRSILKSLQVQPGVRLLSVILYCISFSFFNFWPWYNHTVIVYEMIGLAFLLKYFFNSRKWIWLSLSGLFVFFSFFTKQDGGGLALALCVALTFYVCLQEKNWKPLLIFCASFLVAGFIIIAPLLQYNFRYWFNYGQPPHTSRISVFEIADEFFMNSQTLKFYLVLIALLAIVQFKRTRDFFSNKKETVFLLLTLGIITEAIVLQVTSYTPPDNNIFFHSFAFAYILSQLAGFLNLNFYQPKILVVGGSVLLLWWSGVFWKYMQRIAQRALPGAEAKVNSTENIINRNTYKINPPTGDIPLSQWTFAGLRSFEKIYMPKPTVDGIHRLMNSSLVKASKKLRVLNMTELTPLAAELPYEPEAGPHIPLWHHLGVAMFNKEAAQYEQKIINQHYDLVLFEYVPTLNNFFPFRVRDSLLHHYQKTDSFPAPRRGDTQGIIEVFLKKQKQFSHTQDRIELGR